MPTNNAADKLTSLFFIMINPLEFLVTIAFWYSISDSCRVQETMPPTWGSIPTDP